MTDRIRELADGAMGYIDLASNMYHDSTNWSGEEASPGKSYTDLIREAIESAIRAAVEAERERAYGECEAEIRRWTGDHRRAVCEALNSVGKAIRSAPPTE